MTITTPPTGRIRILDEAASLFLQSGYAGTSLRDIAAAAGMKAGSIYYHFESKDQILEDVLRHGVEAVNDAFDDVGEQTSDADPVNRLTAHVAGHLTALFEHGAFTAAHVTMFHTVPDEVRDAIIPLRDAYEARWSGLLAELAPTRAGHDLSLARLMLLGAMNSSVEWFDPEGSQTPRQLAIGIVSQFWLGFGAD